MRLINCIGPWYRIDALAGSSIADVWLFGEIGWEVTAQTFLDQLKTIGNITDLHVHINSVGGSVFEGLAIYNLLQSHPANVTVTVEGFALSMGSVIAMAGKTVRMQSASMLMIHNPAGVAFGTAEDMRKMAMTLDQVRDVLVEIYARKSGQTVDAIKEWMDAETWFTSTEALEHGFIDELVEADTDEQMKSMAATARDEDLSRFTNVPASVRAMATGTGAAPEPKNAATAAHEEQARMTHAASLADEQAATIQAKAVADERARVASIEASFNLHPGHDDVRAACIRDGLTVEAANAKLLEAIAAKQVARPAALSTQIVHDRRDKLVEGATKALLAKGRVIKDDSANEFRSYSLMDLAQEFAALHDIRRSGFSSREGWLQAIMLAGSGARARVMPRIVNAATVTQGTDSFSSVLADVAHKALMVGFDETAEIYPFAARIVSMSDFRAHKFAGLSEFSDLDTVGEHQEYRIGQFSDLGQNATLATYGKLYNISRQAIINDDLMAFTDAPRRMGRAARRKVGDLFANIFITPQTMDYDSATLFVAAHDNVVSAAAPSTTQFDAMRVKMKTQTDVAGLANVGNDPRVILVPEAYRGQAITVVESETEVASSQNNSRKPNSVRNMGAVYSDPRFDAASVTDYYMTSDPNTTDACIVGLLDGVDAPFVEQVDLHTVDGISLKVRMDAVAKILNHRNAVKSGNASA